MEILGHIALFSVSGGVIWLMSGALVGATDRVAVRHRKTGFAVAFVILGFLTSISEISVATNATLEGIPQVSAGNLLGASLVIFLLVIPLLAVLGNGIPMMKALSPGNMALILLTILVPSVLSLDGRVSRVDGALMLALYVGLLLLVRRNWPAEDASLAPAAPGRRADIIDFAKIAAAGVLIFGSGHILVSESVYFAQLLKIPVSFVGLLLLSIGTNIPELIIAVRCIVGRHKDIAFGDYLGSALTNVPIFGLLAIANGSFTIERSASAVTFVLLTFGLVLFFVFCRSKNCLSRREGMILLSIYSLFLLFQLSNAARLAGSGDVPYEALLHSAASTGTAEAVEMP